jgi:hypothetical protein
MTLQEFKQTIEALPADAEFNYSISEPFSWRGSYDEVAFAIEYESSTRNQILDRIEQAYSGVFGGYKGGQYSYCDYTEVHFEENYGRYTDGEYTENWISRLTGSEPVKSAEQRLVNLIFVP